MYSALNSDSAYIFFFSGDPGHGYHVFICTIKDSCFLTSRPKIYSKYLLQLIDASQLCIQGSLLLYPCFPSSIHLTIFFTRISCVPTAVLGAGNSG